MAEVENCLAYDYHVNVEKYAFSIGACDPETLSLLPHVMIFDPMQSQNIKIICPHCEEDRREEFLLTSTGEWECGQSTGKHPRVIWDNSWYCALVGRIYRCQNGHSITSYHAGVLKQLDIKKLPFVLSHKCGLTRSAYDTIIRLVENGNNFSVIEAIYAGSFIDKIYEKLTKNDAGNFEEIINELKRISSYQ